MSDSPQTIYGTCVSVDDSAALLRGDSGTGKSDLAFRFIQTGQECHLVADDRVVVRVINDQPVAECHEVLAGMIEVRGVGIVSVPYKETAVIKVIVDLVSPDEVPRMQIPLENENLRDFAGIALPHFKLCASEASAPLKLRKLIEICSNLTVPER